MVAMASSLSSRPPVDPMAARLVALCDRFGVDILYVFGSRAAEVAAALHQDPPPALEPGGSDVDIGVKGGGEQGWGIKTKVELAIALELLLGVDRVDLVDLAQADPFLAVNVMRGERLFARDADEADDYELYLLRRAADLAPLERERIRLILEPRP